MELNINTKAEGKYTFYNVDENDNLFYIGESDNLITKEGLEYIKTKNWVDCFTTIRLGDAQTAVGATPGEPPFNSLQLNSEIVFSDVPNANPGAGTYVTGSFNPGDAITYVFFRSWKITNTAPSDWTIREVGASPSAPAAAGDPGDVSLGTALFSHSYLPLTTQVVVSAGQSVIAMYELRLTTTSVFSGGNIAFYTGGNSSYQIPAVNHYGVLGCPFACLKNDGTSTVVANQTNDNNRLFEPSSSQIGSVNLFAGYIGKPTGLPGDTDADLVNSFHAARAAFQKLTPVFGEPQGPLYANENSGNKTRVNPAAPTNYKLYDLGNSPHAFSLEPETQYVYKRSLRITTAPVPSQELNGLFICTNTTPLVPGALPTNTNISGNAWMLVFDSTWVRKNNTYLELAITHTWS